MLDEVATDDDPPEVLDAPARAGHARSNRIWEQLGRSQDELEPPAATYRRLRLQMLVGRAQLVLEARDSGTYDDEVLRKALQAIDLEESLLDRIEDAAARVDDELVTPEQRAGDCEHLRDAPRVVQPRTPDGCEECLRDGTRVGASAAVPGLRARRLLRLVAEQHATAHYHETEHPVMRSIEPGEAWRWCFVDDLLG